MGLPISSSAALGWRPKGPVLYHEHKSLRDRSTARETRKGRSTPFPPPDDQSGSFREVCNSVGHPTKREPLCSARIRCPSGFQGQSQTTSGDCSVRKKVRPPCRNSTPPVVRVLAATSPRRSSDRVRSAWR